MSISIGKYPKRKTNVIVSKDEHPNVNIGFSKFCALRPKWCVLAGSKLNYSVCVCSAHQNIVLQVHAVDWDLTYKDLIK